MEQSSSYLDILPPEIGARIDRLLKHHRFFAKFPDLDPEIQMYVAMQLRYPDLMRFCTTSTATKRICDDDFFWKLKTQRDFGIESSKLSSTWKEEYEFHLEQAGLQLIEASIRGDIERVEELLDFGVNPNIQDDWNHTALIKATRRKRTDTVKLLLEAGAKPNIQNGFGNTALIVASIEGYIEIVKLLLKHGAHPNLQYNTGETALQFASHQGHTKIVKLLLKNGADPNIKDDYGWTALKEAARHGYTEIIRILKEYGAKS